MNTTHDHLVMSLLSGVSEHTNVLSVVDVVEWVEEVEQDSWLICNSRYRHLLQLRN